jgi:hypothetical protein
LVTPVERVGIKVDDVPFVAVRVDVEDRGDTQKLRFLTNMGDETIAGPDHPLRVESRGPDREPQPYVHVRGGLDARIARSVFYELVGIAEERTIGGRRVLGVRSSRQFFALGSPEA